MNVLIIEDEKAAARNLSSLIGDIDPNISIIGVVDSVVESVEWYGANTHPDLIFMDIHLADGSAFDIFERCAIESPVIFTTAYDEYAIKAFKVNSIDYLLKPISESDLSRAIGKFRRLQSKKEALNPEVLHSLIHTIHSRSYITHLLIPQNGDKITPLNVNDIAFFAIEDGIVSAISCELKHYVVPHTLDQLVEILNPAQFYRANRQYIISKNDVSQMELWFGGRLSVKLKSSPDTKITINKPRVTEFKEWFSGIIRSN